jgi:hypothetical protein
MKSKHSKSHSAGNLVAVEASRVLESSDITDRESISISASQKKTAAYTIHGEEEDAYCAINDEHQSTQSPLSIQSSNLMSMPPMAAAASHTSLLDISLSSQTNSDLIKTVSKSMKPVDFTPIQIKETEKKLPSPKSNSSSIQQDVIEPVAESNQIRFVRHVGKSAVKPVYSNPNSAVIS